MTISNDNNKNGPYSGNGVTTRFERTFRVKNAAELHVYETTLGITTEVTTGITKEDLTLDTGDVVFATAPATGTTIMLIREKLFVQETDYSAQGKVSPEQVEDDVDETVMLMQDINERAARALSVDIASDDPDTFVPEANTFMAFDALKQPFASAGDTGVPTSPFMATFVQATTGWAGRDVLDVDARVISKSAAYTTVAGDRSKLIRGTATMTLSLEAAADLGDGWFVDVYVSAGTLTIDPDAAEAINGAATLVLQAGHSTRVSCDGTSFHAHLLGAPKVYDNYAAFKASTEVSRGLGAIWHYGDGSGTEVASGHISNSAGTPVELEVIIDKGWFSVKAFGALGNGSADDAAIIRAVGTAALAQTYIPGIWFPEGIYVAGSPIRFLHSFKVDGFNAQIKAKVGFTALTVDVAGGGTIDLDNIFVFLLGDYNDIAGAQRESAFIGSGITLDANDVVKSGLYIERMPYSDINCGVDSTIAGGSAIDVGTYCWGVKCSGNVIENFAEDAISFGIGCNGVVVDTPRIWGDTKTGVRGVVFKDGANTNGGKVSGGFIEKLTHGVFVGTVNGPLDISGVDFEAVAGNCVRSIGDLTDPAGRLVGPTTVKNCYMSSSGYKVYADNARIAVEGCRLRTGGDFETVNSGIIISRDNEFENAPPSIKAGSVVELEESLPWIPVLWDDSLSSGEGQTASIEIASYKRIGDEVHIKGRIAMSSLGTLGAGQTARIGPLPFTSSTVANSHSVASVGYATGLNLAAAAGISGYIGTGANYITLQKFSAVTGATNLTIGEVTATTDLMFDAIYTID